ncbi:hypothetical protein KUV50_07780 [Membranicola marinus]|uniref:Uncharacterized protein n=1 Tax=Membranihabitans marinus TaxID=1227546 RepID=A0A953HMW0_9BACT|nr:hypothetical protein [Membranihabitans marinus]MBY5958024.1 hypothetical protein [Membranihabitans marinus]
MKQKYLWITELIWWVGSLIIGVAIIWPYYPKLIVKVPFLIPNIVLVILMIQCFRLTLFLKRSPFPAHPWTIYMSSFAFIPICIYVVNQYSQMSQFFESSSWMHSFSYLLTLSEKSTLAVYIRTEFTLVAVVAFISGISFSGRMILTSWRFLGNRTHKPSRQNQMSTK